MQDCKRAFDFCQMMRALVCESVNVHAACCFISGLVEAGTFVGIWTVDRMDWNSLYILCHQLDVSLFVAAACIYLLVAIFLVHTMCICIQPKCNTDIAKGKVLSHDIT